MFDIFNWLNQPVTKDAMFWVFIVENSLLVVIMLVRVYLCRTATFRTPKEK